jgi:dTDP-glucose 4,6-dehydratase
MEFTKTLLVTGGAGFIGSHVVRRLVINYPEYLILNIDKLTYAGNLNNLKDIENKPNYKFFQIDITDKKAIDEIFQLHLVDGVIHLAAESHVDRSISNPDEFILTNVVGTLHLLNACKSSWSDFNGKCFYHISTDEVYGSLGDDGLFTEETSYDPRSPYSASKASSDHIVRAYGHTYNLPIKISNCSNNYGSFQFPEKLIPLMINNIKNKKSLPIYGKGENVRDWLWVVDHAIAIDLIYHEGVIGETYNIGSKYQIENIKLAKLICNILDKLVIKKPKGVIKFQELITFVHDRPAHDRKYNLNVEKIKSQLFWEPLETFDTGILKTIKWYLNNKDWWMQIKKTNKVKF